MKCPSCGHENAAPTKFCGDCGAALPVAQPETREKLTDAAERRQLTVVFCDLASSTELSARLDPEDLREIIRDFQRAAAEAVSEHDGHIAQHLGDGILVYFGYPRAHEDDAVRSVHAALGIVARVRALGDRMGAAGVRLAVRVGIHTGLAVVGEVGSGGAAEQLAIGETPNVAARLQGVAEPDSIVVSAETAKLVRRAFELAALEPVSLKGLQGPRTVFRVVGPRSLTRAEHSDEDVTPFVGREAETSALRTLWEQTRKGSGRAVVIRGEAGVGKSRLCALLDEWASAAGDRVLHARCSAYFTHTPMRPMVDLLARLAGYGDDDARAAKVDAIERCVADAGLPASEHVSFLLGVAGLGDDVRFPAPALSPQARRQRAIASVVKLVLASAHRRPLAICVEDLHWIDQSTLEVLGAIVEHVAEAPVLLVLTCRPQFQPPWQIDTEIALHRLSREAVERIVAHVTGGVALPAEVAQQIVAKADGNPLFVEELTRMVVESGLLVAGDGRSYRASGPLPSVAIPATLHDSLMARLDRLSPTHRALVQLCATIGRQFGYELIQETLRAFEEDMQGELRRLTDGDLLYQRGTPPRSTFVFRHALIQDAAYGSLLRRTRSRYHARVADVLLARFPDTPPEVLAHHLTEAGRAKEAIERWQAAGQAALAAFALSDALSHLQRGLALLAQLPQSAERSSEIELGLRVLLGVALMLTQGFASPDVEANYTRVLALCEKADAGQAAEFPALWGLWTFSIVSGQNARAQQMGERLLELAARTGDSAITLAGHTARGAAVLMRGKLDEARADFEAGLAVYDAQSHAPLAMLFGQDAGAMCASFLTWAHECGGQHDLAEKRAAEAIAMSDALGQPSTRAFVGTVLATWCCVAGQHERALPHADTVIALAAEQGMPHWDAQASITRGWALAGMGRAGEGAETIRKSIAMLTGLGTYASMTFYWAGLAEAELALGRKDEARAAVDEATRYMDKSDERIYAHGLRALAGRVASA